MMRFGRGKNRGAVYSASSSMFVSPFNKRVKEQLRLNRLHGLRGRLLAGQPVREDEFDHIFDGDELEAIDRLCCQLLMDYGQLRKPEDVCPAYLRKNVFSGYHVVINLQRIIREFAQLRKQTWMSEERLRAARNRLRNEFRREMIEVRYLRFFSQTLTEDDRFYLQDPLALPDVPVKCDFPSIRTSHDFARRFPWRLQFRSKWDFNNWPHRDTLKILPYLWYVEHSLDLPYTHIDRWDFKPKFNW
ncbi:hypothetical protein ACUTJJ_05210 [Agrobacterium sp. DKPNP3]|uniref:hypothetical protein n=1 Tax=Agrobacterium sp. DKPNP3 TaxID=3457323 RepID=UPI004044622B